MLTALTHTYLSRYPDLESRKCAEQSARIVDVALSVLLVSGATLLISRCMGGATPAVGTGMALLALVNILALVLRKRGACVPRTVPGTLAELGVCEERRAWWIRSAHKGIRILGSETFISLLASKKGGIPADICRLISAYYQNFEYFGPASWNVYFGDVGCAPPPPHNLHDILDGPCPFFPGRTVGETHMLALIPETVNGQPLTLNLFELDF